MRRTGRIPIVVAVAVLTLIVSLAPRALDVNRPITFDVAVTDKNDNPVIGLESRNFKVFEDNVEQTITSCGATDKPIAVVVLVEFGDTFVYYYDNVLKPAGGFIRSLEPKDWIGLVTFDVRPEIVTDFTRDKSVLFVGLERLQMPFYRETAIYDAVYFVLERMDDVKEKRAIFLLGSGVDTISKHSYNETLKKADASDTMIYSIGMAQFVRTILEPYMEPSTPIGLLQGDNVMHSLAESTGGLSFFPRLSGKYPRIYETVNSDIRHQYTLGFVSTNRKADGKFRKLKVEVIGTDIDHDVKPDKLKVRHKKGYYDSGVATFPED